MSVVYVIQVMAHHGVGTQGWRTVSRRSGEPYRFRTRAAAVDAMRTHFANLREGINVRVQALPEHPQGFAMPAAPTEPNASDAPQLQHQPADPCP